MARAEDLSHGQRVVGVVIRCYRRVRERGVFDKYIARLGMFEIVVGPEPKERIFLLGRGVDPAALVAGEWPLRIVVGDDVLPKLGANSFKKEAQMTDHGEVAQDGVVALGEVMGCYATQQQNERCKG